MVGNGRKIDICVVGLLGGQQQEVRRKSPGNVRITFVSQDAHEPKYPPRADWILIVKKFTTHKWTAAAYQTKPRDRVVIVDGCVSRLVAKIKEISLIS